MVPVFNFLILLLMLIYEAKSKGYQWKIIKEPKVSIIAIMCLMQVLIFIHYAMATEVARIFLLTMEEGCRTIIVLQLMNYFIRQAKRILKNKARWGRIWNTLWPISLLMYIIAEVYTIVMVAKNSINDESICHSGAYILVQLINLIIMIGFFVLGYFITKRVNMQDEAEDQIEMIFRQQVQRQALKNLWLIIYVFSIVQAYYSLYCFVLYFTQGNCMYPTDIMAIEVFFWTLTRSMQYLVWVYPIMYIFWPRSL